MRPFPGFPSNSPQGTLPEAFFSLLLPYIDDLTELKVTIYLLWLLYRKGSASRFVRLEEILKENALIEGMGGREALLRALKRAVERGTFLEAFRERDGVQETLYFVNSPEGRETMERVLQGEEAAESPAEKNIFTLYEENIGVLNPMIVEELKEAQARYPFQWIEDAFREAAAQNKLRWKYIARILERWASEGRGGEAQRDIKKEEVWEKYFRGRYGRIVQG